MGCDGAEGILKFDCMYGSTSQGVGDVLPQASSSIPGMVQPNQVPKGVRVGLKQLEPTTKALAYASLTVWLSPRLKRLAV